MCLRAYLRKVKRVAAFAHVRVVVVSLAVIARGFAMQTEVVRAFFSDAHGLRRLAAAARDVVELFIDNLALVRDANTFEQRFGFVFSELDARTFGDPGDLVCALGLGRQPVEFLRDFCCGLPFSRLLAILCKESLPAAFP